MKKLCLGTFLRILSDCLFKRHKQLNLISDILYSVKKDDRFIDDSFQGALLSGKNNLTDYDEIKTCEKSELINYFENKIKPYFDEKSQRIAIVCLLDVIKEDALLNEFDIIGFEKEGYIKHNLVLNQVFDFSSFIANLYFYCCSSVSNQRSFKNNIKELKDFVINQMHRYNEVQLETEFTRIQSSIKLTLNINDFNSVFTKVDESKLNISNDNEIKIYRLNVLNNKIDYEKLQKYILNNIGSYVFSRARRNRYQVPEDSMELARETLRAYNKRIKKDISTNHFNELLLYSFLECVLGAPKIFSKMELQDHSGVYNSKTSGVHILTCRHNTLPFNQLVLGTTNSFDKLESAVDNAFNQILVTKESYSDEYEFLETSILNHYFDNETNKSLEALIIPSKNTKDDKPHTAFGVFLGYSVKFDDKVSNYQYKVNLETKLSEDISNIVPYINNKINDLNLVNYSFYIYILPLNDALLDPNYIMKNALGVDE